ncbi:MAG: type II toxin-antitoxin system VapC family toxin [Dehalococcoidia bacterium]|nr:type II toxin-antitoxin system VapC family toxin [Dehalococcoidia bacterium]
MLDSDISVSVIRRRSSRVLRRFEAVPPRDLCVSIVTYGELYFGAVKSDYTEHNLYILEDYAARLTVFQWDRNAASEYGNLRAHLEAQGNPIGVLDTMIAAHALSLNATIVTNNVRHFERVPDLKLENWAIAEDRSTNGQNGWST